MATFDAIASDAVIDQTKQALEANGFTVTIADTAAAAKELVLDKLPKGAEVFTATSKTLEKLGLDKLINESSDYDSVRNKINDMMNDDTKARERRRLGAAPDFALGSVHAVSQDGHVLIASNTGSQLPAYSYGAGHVIWVVGAQKIVKDLAEGEQRLQQHVVPLEDIRSREVYGMPTHVSKLLYFYNEVRPGRVEIVLVKEPLGF
jgi:YkgG family uncharacterized protein